MSPARGVRRLGAITAVNLRGQAGHRANFIAGILDGALWQTSVVVFASVILTRFPTVGDWTNREVLLLAAMRLTSHGLFTLVLGQVVYVGHFVQEGLIDAFLVRPVSVFGQVLTARFNANAFGDLLVGGSLLAVAIGVFDRPWTPGRVVLLVVGIIGGCLLQAAFMTVFSALSLRNPAAELWSFHFLLTLETVGNYPLNILPVVFQALLTTVLPIAFIAYLPAAAITGHAAGTGLPLWLVYASPVVAAALFWASQWVWSRCLTGYQGANS